MPIPPAPGPSPMRFKEYVLDGTHRVMEVNQPGLVILLLNFRLESMRYALDMTCTLSLGKFPKLQDRYNASSENCCYFRLADDTGK